MIRSKFGRLALAAVTGSSLLLTGLAAPSSAQQAPRQLSAAGRTFSFVGTDVTYDESVLYGVLPNGLRYAIMKNATPPGLVAFRLHFAAGSAMEEPDQLGLAHFLEHMAFNGSTNVPEDQLFKIMERLGAQLGADSNAGTSNRETIYMFNVPKSDDASVDTALMLFRETASELKIDPAAVDRERGVVLGEERARDSPQSRAYDASQKAIFGDHPMSRSPIGTIQILKTAPASRIRAFYDAYYRPERATLVVVGDIDPAAVEAKIKAKFSDWKGRGPAGKDPPIVDASSVKPATAVYTETGLTPQVRLTWIDQALNPIDNRAEGRRRLVEQFATNIMNRRFSDVAQSPNPPFLGGGVSNGDTRGVARMTSVSTVGASDLKGSIDSLVRIQRQAVEFGFRQDELDRVIINTRAALVAQVAQTPTRRTVGLAEGLLSAIVNEVALKTPQQNLEGFENVARDVTLDELNAALRRRFSGRGPVLVANDGKPLEGGEAAMAQVFTKALAEPVTQLAQNVVKPWPYTNFGAPGAVTEKREIADLGVTLVKFANGVRLTVKPTTYTKDRVDVRVMFGQGMLDLPRDKVSPAQLWGSAFVPGGLGQMTVVERNRSLTGKSASIGTGIGSEGFLLVGGSRAAELELQMQLLAAHMTDAAWNPPGYEQMRVANAMALQNIDTQPSAVFGLQGPLLMHGNDQRWAPPTPELYRSIELSQVKAVMAPIMADSDLEVVIVGDVTVDEAIAQTAKTFGALPKRKGRIETKGAREVSFPAGSAQPVVLKHKGRADQGIAAIVWPTTGYWKNPVTNDDALIMAQILNERAMEEIRERQGKSYGVGGGASFDKVFNDYGMLMVQTEISAESMPVFFSAVETIAKDLREKEVSQDELDRAVRPARESLNRARQTNSYWVSVLTGVQLEPRRLDDLRRQSTLYDKVTPASVKKAAQTWLVPGKAWKTTVIPASPAVASK